MNSSAGLRWAYTMFGLDLVEFLALVHVLFFDLSSGLLPGGWGFLEFYFLLVTGSFLLQLLGILMVHWGWYRSGGVLQIVSSALHVPKGEGVIGVVGGVKAYRYHRILQETGS